MKTLFVIAASSVLLAGTACREDAGDPDASRLGPIVDPPGFFEEPLPGPDPWVEGENRLSMGIFYEGAYSELLPINGTTTHYYIFLGATGALTYQQVKDEDRIEGIVSDRILHAGGPWWGGGVHFDVPQDFTRWTTMHLSLKSVSPAFAEVQVGMSSEDNIESLDASAYGYAADGQWHSLEIPLADFAELGVDLQAVTDALTLGGLSGTSADALKVDGFYFTAP
jgi:hypothetical protein